MATIYTFSCRGCKHTVTTEIGDCYGWCKQCTPGVIATPYEINRPSCLYCLRKDLLRPSLAYMNPDTPISPTAEPATPAEAPAMPTPTPAKAPVQPPKAPTVEATVEELKSIRETTLRVNQMIVLVTNNLVSLNLENAADRAALAIMGPETMMFVKGLISKLAADCASY